MSDYATIARRYWQTYLPSRYASLSDPETFFRNLADQVTQEIADLTPMLAGDDSPDETYQEKVGRLNAARSQATERAMAELVYLPPEPGTEDQEMPTDRVPGVTYLDG